MKIGVLAVFSKSICFRSVFELIPFYKNERGFSHAVKNS